MQSPISRLRQKNLSSRSHSEFLLFVLAVAILAYLPSLFYQFVYDDIHVIVENPHVQSITFLGHFWTHHIWDASYAPAQGNYYRPLFMDWLVVNHAAFGLNSLGWHLATVLLHIGAAALFYLLACKILRDKPAAVVGTLVFALHPIHTESVAWVCGGSEPLAAVFLLGGYLAYAQSYEATSDSRSWYWASVAFYSLALFCKETAAIMPVTIFTYALLVPPNANSAPWGRRLRKAIAETIPFAAPAALYLVLRSIALKSLLHATPKKSLTTILLTSPSVVLDYLKHLVLPFGLVEFYDVPYVSHPEWRNFALPLLVILMTALALFWLAKRSRVAAFASLWIVIHLFIPVVSISLFWMDLIHDRYLYMSSMGFAILVALGWKTLHQSKRSALAWMTVALLGTVWLAGVVTQEQYWKNNKALFTRSVEISPDGALADCQLAGELIDEGDYSRAEALLQNARAHAPEYWLPPYALGVLHYRVGEYTEAEKYVLQAMALYKKPKADQYFLLGDTRIRMGRVEEGLKDLQTATEMFPGSIEYRLHYGEILEEQGHITQAVGQYKAVLASLAAAKDPLNDGKQLQARVDALEFRKTHSSLSSVSIKNEERQ